MNPDSLISDHLRKVHTAAVELGFHHLRGALLSGIPPAAAASLPEMAQPSAQLLNDLFELSRMRLPSDGLMPLECWLKTAEQLAAGRQEASIFVAARSLVSHSGTPYKDLCLDQLFGREKLVQDLIHRALGTQKTPCLLTGAPGVGKTALLKHLMQAPEIISRFGDRRYWVRLDMAHSGVFAWSELRNAARISSSDPEHISQALGASETLLILDGLDDLVRNDDQGVSHLLSRLLDHGRVILFGSLRSVSGTLSTSKGEHLLIPPLSNEDALCFFDALVPEHRENPGRKYLVDVSDGMPIAVELLARASRGTNLDLLRAAIEKSPSAVMLSAQAGAQWQGVIEATFQLPTMGTFAKTMGSILAALPGGLFLDNTEKLLPEHGLAGALGLLGSGLATLNEGYLDMLQPIRIVIAQRWYPNEEQKSLIGGLILGEAKQCLQSLRSSPNAASAQALRRASANTAAWAAWGLSSSNASAWMDVLLEVSRVCRDYGGAQQPIEQVRDKAQKLGDSLRSSRCELFLAVSASRNGSSKVSPSRLNAAIQALKSEGSISETAEATLKMAEFCLEAGEPERASSCISECQGMMGPNVPHNLTVRILLLKSRTASMLGDTADALEFAKQAHKRCDMTGANAARAACLRRMGELSRRLNEGGNAQRYYNEALHIYEAQKNQRGMALCCWVIAQVDIDRDRFESARSWLARALDDYRKIKDSRGEAHVLMNCGDIELFSASFDAARDMYRQAEKLYQLTGYHIGIGWCLCRFGDICVAEKDFLAAKPFYEAVTDSGISDAALIAAVHVGLADVYIYEGRMDVAEQYLNKSMVACRKLRDDRGVAECLRGYGDRAHAMGQPGEAKRFYIEAIRLFEGSAYKRGQAECAARIERLNTSR